MKYNVQLTNKFKKDYKLAEKRGYDMNKIKKVIALLSNDEILPEHYHDHALTGNYAGFRECHIEPDWLLVYRKENNLMVLLLSRTGTHSDLF